MRLLLWHTHKIRSRFYGIETPPKIAGVFSEGDWEKATKTELAYQKESQENDPLTEKTEVYLAFDKENLYVAFRTFAASVENYR